MFILIMVMILGTTISILGSIYYNTISLQKSYGTVNSYYGAYYGAISSVERGLLMTKLKYPGYVGEGGFDGNTIIGSNSNGFSGDFWKLNQGDNSMTWSVDSSTSRIVGTIDTKTNTYLSFVTHTDPNRSGFTNEGISTGTYGVADGLILSGWVKPTRGINIDTDEQRDDVDFNRAFVLKDSGYTVRSLIKSSLSTGEKDYELSGNFEFKRNTCNPRQAQSGEYVSGYYGYCDPDDD